MQQFMSNNAYDAYGQQQKGKQATFGKAPNLNTSELKQIVDQLNRPPFMQHLSMVEFDDKAPLELLELVNRIFANLDKEHEDVDMQKETQDKTEERICGYLKVLGYPADFNPNFCRDVVHGDKKTIQHILWWMLSRLQDLQRKAYTARFLVPLAIPDEFLVDEDMRATQDEYRDLQAEFQAVHQGVESVRNESMNPTDLKKEISQLEQEREQLLTKINLFKNKGNSEEFQQLLQATSKLRKEQEQDAKLNEKERELGHNIEGLENQMLQVRQQLMNSQKQQRDQITPQQMLTNIRNEARKNHEMKDEIIGRELNDKRDRLQKIELLLQEPATTQAELEKLTSDVRRLNRETQDLDVKIQQNAPANDNLAVYKSQANGVSKKKEQKNEEFKKLEVEKQALERALREKEEQYVQKKGQKFMKKDDFRQYAASLRTKNTQFKSMKKQLEEIKSEVVVLDRTKQILKSKAGDVDEFLRDLEKKQGVQGFSKVEDQIQDASELKEKLDNAKSQSMQELTGLIQRIDSEVKEKKQRLAPEIKRLRTLRNKYTEIEVDYNERKRNYDAVCSQLESEKERMDKDMGTGLREFKESESKYHQNNVQADIYEAFQKRLSLEAKYLSDPQKRLSPEFKSYQEFFNAKLKQQDGLIKDLRTHQRHIKDNAENYSQQMQLFKNLRHLLEIKRKTQAEGGDGLVGYQDSQAQGYDRFVVRDD